MSLQGKRPADSQKILQVVLVLLGFGAIAWLSFANLEGYTSPLMIPDEFGYMTPAAFWAGYDWSGVTQGLPWYSFGFSLALLPVFLLLEPEQWYSGAQLVNGILLVASVPMLVSIVRSSGVQSKSPIVPWAAAAMVLLYPSVFLYSRLAAAETIILAATLAVVLLVRHAVIRGDRWPDLLALGAFCAALYFIHSRLIATIAAALFVVTLSGYTRSAFGGAVRSAGFFVVGMVPVTFSGLALKSHLISDLYGGQMYGGQHSLVQSISSRIQSIGSVDGLVSLLSVGAGQVTYLLVSTFGVAALGLFWCIHRVYTERVSRAEASWRLDVALVVPVFLVMNLVITLAVSVLALSIPAFPHHVFYGRYIEPAMLPVFAVGVAAVLSGAAKWRWLVLGAALVFAVPAPGAMKLAASLPAENTYWILIAGLFPFRGGAWSIDYPLLFGGFACSVLLLWLGSRLNPWLGTLVLGALLGLGSVDLVSNHRDAGIARQLSLTAISLDARSGKAGVVFDSLEDLQFLRTEAQLANPQIRVVTRREVEPNSAMANYERISVSWPKVLHSLCLDTGRTGGDCRPLTSEGPAFGLELLRFPARELVTSRVSGAEQAFHRFAGMPFVRVLGISRPGIDLGFRVRSVSGDPRGAKLVVFVTEKGRPNKWLNDVRTPIELRPNQNWLESKARVSLLDYAGTPLQPGSYEIHVVVQTTGGYLWGTRVSTGLKIEP